MARRGRNGAGFSLLDIAPVLQDMASTLVAELTRQGVDANPDMIFRGLQDLVTASASANGIGMGGGYTATASERKEPITPYNHAADFLVVANEYYQNGDKKDAIKHVLQAFEQVGADTLFDALLVMNNAAVQKKPLLAEDGDEDENIPLDDTENSGEDNSSDDGDSDDIDDAEIEQIIDEQENADDGNSSDEDDSGDDEADDKNDESNAPMGGGGTVESSDAARRILAIKMSSSGSTEDRNKAARILNQRR